MEATVPWLQKVERDGPGKFKSMSEIEEEIAKNYNFFKQFDTVEDFIDHKDAKNSVGNVRTWHILLFFCLKPFSSINLLTVSGKERMGKKNPAQMESPGEGFTRSAIC